MTEPRPGTATEPNGSESATPTVVTRARAVVTHPAAVVVAPLVVIAIAQLVGSRRFVPNFDYAVQELAVQEAAHGQRLLGPYSQWGWYHPGPLLFYTSVPWYEAVAHNGGVALVLTRLTVDAACGALIVVLVDRIGGRLTAWGAALGIVWFEMRVGLDWFRDPWNPYAVVLPTALALVAAAALHDRHGTRWRLIVLVLAGSFAVQSHVGSGPLVALAVVIGGIALVRSASVDGVRAMAPSLLVAAIAGIACWALPLWQQLTSDRGNLHDLVAFFTEGAAHPPIDRVIGPVTVALTLPFEDSASHLGPEPFDTIGSVDGWWVLVAVGLLVVAGVGAVRAWRAQRVGMAVLGATVPLAFGAALLGALRIRGTLQPYLFAPALTVGLLAYLTAGATLGSWLGSAGLLPARAARIAMPAATVAVAAIALFVGSAAFEPADETFANPLVDEARPAIEELCDLGRAVRLQSESAAWWDASAVAAAIGECAPDVRLDRELELLVGTRRTEATNDLVVRMEMPAVPPADGWRRLTEGTNVSIDVQDEQ